LFIFNYEDSPIITRPGPLLLLRSAALIVSIVVCVLLTSCTKNDGLEQKNVIIILVDTLRRDHVGKSVENTNLSPFISSLGEKGFCFHNAVSASSWTKPSVASLFTGLYPSRHEAIGSHNRLTSFSQLDEKRLTLAEILKKEGFETAAFITNPNISSTYKFDQGFDLFTEPSGEAEELIGKAVEWIKERKTADKNFFCYLHLIDPHMPYFPPAEYRKRFASEAPESKAPFISKGDPFVLQAWSNQYRDWIKENPGEEFSFDLKGALGKKSIDLKQAKAKIEDKIHYRFAGWDDPSLVSRVEYLESLYKGEVAYTDKALSYYIEQLEAMGVLDDTILIVTSDHGEAFFEHEFWGHGSTVYWEEINVPLIFNVKDGGRVLKGDSRNIVSLVDLYPTILDMLDIETPDGLDGETLWDVIRTPKQALDKRQVFSETIHTWGDVVSAQTNHSKLILTIWADGKIKWRFFDLTIDAFEKNPISLKGGGAIAKALKRSIEGYLDQRPVFEDKGEHSLNLSAEELKKISDLGY